MALEIDPRYAPAHNNLGVVYERQGKRNEAIAEYRAALAADPELKDAKRNLDRLAPE
jgi:Tfp pilus assembly protein PilF